MKPNLIKINIYIFENSFIQTNIQTSISYSEKTAF